VECLGNLKSDQAKFGEEMTHASRKFWSWLKADMHRLKLGFACIQDAASNKDPAWEICYKDSSAESSYHPS
jgi:hypothetical protein